MKLESVDPELFSPELYNPYWLHELRDAPCVAMSIWYFDASLPLVRPKDGGVSLIVEWENGTKYWCHANRDILDSIREGISFMDQQNELTGHGRKKGL